MMKALSPLFAPAAAVVLASSVIGAPATASEPTLDSEFTPLMLVYMLLTVEDWTHDPALLDAVRNQNARTANLTEEEILAQDTLWRNSNETDELVATVLHNPATDFLMTKSQASNGLISEIILTDARGLNVASTVMTSDYWQGDEDKHNETYELGPGAVHIGELEIDTSTGAFQGQGSMTVTDPVSGEAIGAITVGFLPNEF